MAQVDIERLLNEAKARLIKMLEPDPLMNTNHEDAVALAIIIVNCTEAIIAALAEHKR